MARVRTGPKVLVAALVIGGALYGVRSYMRSHGEARSQVVDLERTRDLVDFKEATPTPTPAGTVQMPAQDIAALAGPPIRMMIIPWNSQQGLLFANGGPVTTSGSLMAEAGVKLAIERQDDYGAMALALETCARELKAGANVCSKGVNFVSIMGDAAAGFFVGLNGVLTAIDPAYKARAVVSTGRSYGEDKFMGPPRCAENPNACRGLLVSGVLKDGDWNIAVFWADQNDICNNPDPTTWHPNCLNWVSTTSFTEADEKYINGACEDRPVVATVNGRTRKTGKTKRVCVEGVVTWTPGDVEVNQKKGGLVSLLSTRENSSQMPQLTIGIDAWNKSHRDMVQSFVDAALRGGDAVKRSAPARMRAAAISAQVYKEGDAAYWAKYYEGTKETDATGQLVVPLGGSRVFNLADNLLFFGLTPGSSNAFEATYVTFGDYVKVNYPTDLPSYPAWNEVFDTAYIEAVAARAPASAGKADAVDFSGATASETVAARNWSIEFDSGQATFTGPALRVLTDVQRTLVVSQNTFVELHGHTDSTGTRAGNQVLSEARARAVQTWLEAKAPANFPQGRITVTGHGQDQPVASNDTSGGRAKNRRVQIVLKGVAGS